MDMTASDPGTVQYSPFDQAIFDDPYPVYERLRAESPVHYLEEFDCWALSTFEDVWNACQSPDLFTAEKGTTAGHVLQHVVEVFPALDMMDPPRHTEHRALISPRFLPGKVKQFEADFRKIVRDRLEIVRGTGHFDVVQDLGSHLSTLSVCRVLDFPEEDGDMLRGWVDAIFFREPGSIGITQAGIDGFANLDAYCLDLVKTRRASGVVKDDVLGRYLAATIDGQPMTDDKVASLMKELTVAGTETLPKMLAATLRRLWEFPDARREVLGSTRALVGTRPSSPRRIPGICIGERPAPSDSATVPMHASGDTSHDSKPRSRWRKSSPSCPNTKSTSPLRKGSTPNTSRVFPASRSTFNPTDFIPFTVGQAAESRSTRWPRPPSTRSLAW
jgi:cytochrome P450